MTPPALWAEDLRVATDPFLYRLAAVHVTGRDQSDTGRSKISCPVGNFHVRNGAQVFRLNWNGDTSARGVSSSLGIMVNYKYELDDLKRNNQAYTQRGHVEMSKAVAELLDGA